MKYPENLRIIVDVTKPPYCADNTGKEDCTEILRRVYNDIIEADVALVRETYDKLKNAPENENTYIGFQSRHMADGTLNVSYSEDLPPARVMYFPKGTYLVSDTIVYQTRKSRKFHMGRFFFELNRNIHFEGECMEETVIKLQDHAKGFEYGQIRPIINFHLRTESLVTHCANNAMLNTFKDITIDCGQGNPGAVGLKYYANNTGRVSNVTIRSSDPDRDGFAGILLAGNSIGSFTDIRISGYDYGVLVLEGARDLFENMVLEDQKIQGVLIKTAVAVFKDIKSKNTVPTIMFDDNETSVVSLINVEGTVRNGNNNCVYTREEKGDRTSRPVMKIRDQNNQKHSLNLPMESTPSFAYGDLSEWVCVDDFGARGDGVTDSTEGIQRALESGARVVYFNEGRYLITDEIYIPSTVCLIDFCYCDMAAGEKLVKGTGMGAFVIAEDSPETLFMQHAFTWERFCGMFRFVRHSARRDIVLRDNHIQAGSVYFNTVPGSRVFIDDVACTTGDFSHWYLYRRPGQEPVFASNIPFEFHGQKVWARNINPERADLEMLNDGGEVVILGAYVEGPGTVLKTINGGKSEIINFNASLAVIRDPSMPVIVNDHSDVSVVSGQITTADYPVVIREIWEDGVKDILLEQLPDNRCVHGYIGELVKWQEDV